MTYLFSKKKYLGYLLSMYCTMSVYYNCTCRNVNLASIATLPTEAGDDLEEQDMYSP